jgi:hypothetical protein
MRLSEVVAASAIWGARCGKSARRVLSGGTGTRCHVGSVRPLTRKGSNGKAPQRLKLQGPSLPAEEEFADDKRPDLRFHGANFDGPVPVELKLADNWTGPSLFERLENQLCGDYLRDNRSNRGIFALVYRGEKIAWDVPDSDNRVDFPGLIAALQDHWSRISAKYPNIDDVTVIGIDLTKRLK